MLLVCSSSLYFFLIFAIVLFLLFFVILLKCSHMSTVLNARKNVGVCEKRCVSAKRTYFTAILCGRCWSMVKLKKIFRGVHNPNLRTSRLRFISNKTLKSTSDVWQMFRDAKYWGGGTAPPHPFMATPLMLMHIIQKYPICNFCAGTSQ